MKDNNRDNNRDTYFSWISLPRSHIKKLSGKLKSDIARLDPKNSRADLPVETITATKEPD
jgi:hypothetical protein